MPYGIRRVRNRGRIQLLKKVLIFGVALCWSCFPLAGYFASSARSNRFSALKQHNRDVEASSLSLLDRVKASSNDVDTENVEQTSSVPSMAGKLHLHTWSDLCGTSVDFLRNSPHFPYFPDKRSVISTFQASQGGETQNGQRIFGFFHPLNCSNYKFAISSDDTSELWLSLNEDPALSQLIARVYSPAGSAWTFKGDYKKYPTQISQKITLQPGKRYFIEALTKQSIRDAHVEVYWACLDSNSTTFQIISSRYLSTFADDVESNKFQYGNTDRIPCHAGKEPGTYSQVKSDLYRYIHLPFVEKEQYYGSIPTCPYSPSFLVKEKLVRNQGVRLVKMSRVFPEDDTNMHTGHGIRRSGPNELANKSVIQTVVNKFVSSLKSRKLFLKRIYRVIQKPDPGHGDRFFVDLELGLKGTNDSFRLSEHLYLRNSDNNLCLPEGIIWNSKATVYLILPVKNQGKWVYHFINQLSAASLLTGDTNFHVMVIDFESEDLDMVKAFNTSLLTSRHTIVNMKGKFYKTLALNKAVELVPSPHDIVFLFDLHIDVPADILDSVRKNTVEGRIAYFPVVGRLNCNSNSVEHRGFWERFGFGLAAVYKSDWIRFGGMNINDFKFKWGGEDYDLVDRVMSAQLEVERIQYPGLYHHFHYKQMSWN